MAVGIWGGIASGLFVVESEDNKYGLIYGGDLIGI